MSSLIAKRYVKALLKDRSEESIKSINSSLESIATAFNDEKFISIISSTDISDSSKIELIYSFVSEDKTIENLIKLLAEKKRLNIIPQISIELKKEIAVLTNSYDGIVSIKQALNDADLKAIEDKFSTKFDIKLTLAQDICDYDGIKVDIEGLGVEIGFSKDRLKSQMIEHILKAV